MGQHRGAAARPTHMTVQGLPIAAAHHRSGAAAKAPPHDPGATGRDCIATKPAQSNLLQRCA